MAELVASAIPCSRRPPLEFVFSGYTLWLKLKETSSDITNALHSLTDSTGLEPHEPHVTLLYDVKHESREAAVESFQQIKAHIRSWPALQPIGCVCDTELAGVNGGTMTMRWAEVSYRCDERHDQAWQRASTLFAPSAISSAASSSSSTADDTKNSSSTVESSNVIISSWKPHLSLAYDNPSDSPLTVQQLLGVLGQFPSLSEDREVQGISLVDTHGSIDCWRVLDTHLF